MRILLYRWIKNNSIILVNAGSLVATNVVQAVLGFAFWWVAARLFTPQAVGLASAATSAMMLLGTLCILGLGTLLIGELPRQPGKKGSLISAALILVGGVAGCSGIVFALVAPFISADFQALRSGLGAITLFAVGVSVTAITVVLDQALIGLLRGDLQFLRNILFTAAKLVALVIAGLWLAQKVGMTIYATWAAGNALSLVALAGFAVSRSGWSARSYLPHWGLLRKLRSSAIEHHILNLILQVPDRLLPVLVTVLLSAAANAWFYVSWMIAGFLFLVSFALTTVLYATNSAQPNELAHKIRATLGLAFVTSVLANLLLQFGANQILGLFGHIYAEQASLSLRVLALGAFPAIIRNHYIALCRIQGRILHATLPMTAVSLFELGAAALGAHLGGVPGLSLAWVAAVYIEAMFMFKTVFKAAFPTAPSISGGQLRQHTAP